MADYVSPELACSTVYPAYGCVVLVAANSGHEGGVIELRITQGVDEQLAALAAPTALVCIGNALPATAEATPEPTSPVFTVASGEVVASEGAAGTGGSDSVFPGSSPKVSRSSPKVTASGPREPFNVVRPAA